MQNAEEKGNSFYNSSLWVCISREDEITFHGVLPLSESAPLPLADS